MSGPWESPFTGLGRLQGDLESIKSEVSRKANDYEIRETNSALGRLEHSVRQLESTVDSLRTELQDVKDKLAIYEDSK